MRTVFFVFCLFTVAASVYATIPRGVAPANAAKYDMSAATYVCPTGPGSIPTSKINDGVCDCHDGSDEPGTPACASVLNFLGDDRPGFVCTKGPATTIGYTRVNDGICDCCDGSDEYAEDVECENTCAKATAGSKQKAADQADANEKKELLRLEAAEKMKKWKAELAELHAEAQKSDDVLNEAGKVMDQATDDPTEAFNAYNRAMEKRLEIEKKVSDREVVVSDDYGPDSLYVVLRDQEFTYKAPDGESIFIFRPYTSVAKKSRTNLKEKVVGTWQGFVDVPSPLMRVPAKTHDIDKDHSSNLIMTYLEGEACDARDRKSRALVHFVCGVKNEIVDMEVSPVDNCAVNIRFQTPIVC